MNLDRNLLRGIYSHGFEHPSAIQQKAIVPTSSGRDIIAQAQSGTGKTATFVIGSLAQIDFTSNRVQTLILCPTRELANQNRNVATAIGHYMGAKVYSAVGGSSIQLDVEAFKEGVHVVTGTPGRVLDLASRGIFDTSAVKTLILDEADEMLSLGFKDQIYDIFQLLPAKMQVGLFSATMSAEALEITKKFMVDPITIFVEQDEITLRGIRQYYINCEKEQWKFDVLTDLYDTLNIAQTVIFANTKKKVTWLADQLQAKDFTVSVIHGEMAQADRSRVLQEFKDGLSRILLTTDLISRGIDVHGVSLVINYELPRDHAKYIHRIGRSGRFGRKGVAINLMATHDFDQLNAIDKYYCTKCEEMPNNIADYLV